MKCILSKQVELYIRGGLSPRESLELEKHVEHCDDCQDHLASMQETRIDMDYRLEEAPSLSDNFTAGVLQHLNVDRQTRLARNRGWRTVWKAAAVSFIGLLVVLSLSVFLSPTLASYVKSFFMTARGDQGLKHAAELGLSMQHDMKMTDHGITLHIQEVLADTERVAVVCDVVDSNGRSLVGRDDVDLLAGIKLTDVAGQTEIGSWTYKMNEDRALLESEIGNLQFQGKLPDEVVIHFNYTELGGIKGSWKTQIPIHLATAKAAAKKIAVQQRYTSPEGYSLGLQRIELAPSGIGIVTETNQEDMKRNAAPMYNFAYRLLDDKGRTLRVHEEFLEEEGYKAEQLTLMGPLTQPSSEPDWQEWNDLFAPLQDHSTNKLIFKLDAFYIKEKINASKTIIPEELKHQTAILEDKGNRLELSHFRIQQGETKETFLGRPLPKKGGIMEFEGTLAQNVIAISDIRITDDTGAQLPYGFSTHERTKDAEGLVHIRGILSLPDLTEEPNHLTIGFHEMRVKNTKVDWEVPILLDSN